MFQKEDGRRRKIWDENSDDDFYRYAQHEDVHAEKENSRALRQANHFYEFSPEKKNNKNYRVPNLRAEKLQAENYLKDSEEFEQQSSQEQKLYFQSFINPDRDHNGISSKRGFDHREMQHA